jgi:hypothetical protein
VIVGDYEVDHGCSKFIVRSSGLSGTNSILLLQSARFKRQPVGFKDVTLSLWNLII